MYDLSDKFFFVVIFSGLQDQLLALVVMQERPDLEEARSMLVVSSAQMNQELQEIEDRILYKLSVSEGSPVDDIDLIQTLEASKLKSEEIKVNTINYIPLFKFFNKSSVFNFIFQAKSSSSRGYSNRN